MLTGMTVASGPVELPIDLDRSSPVPLYHQLAVALERAISDGRLRPGDRLENELALTTRLGLARPTARQAIQELVRKGLLVRKRGVGTQVVAAAPIRRDVKFSSLHDDLASSGHEPATELLERATGTAVELGVDDLVDVDEPLTYLRRLRRVDGEPLAIMSNYLPAHFRLDDEDLRARGLYATLRAQGVGFAIAHQTIGARLVTTDEAALLGETEPAACVTMQRVVYDDTGQLVELGRHIYRASQYSVQTSLVV
jgi:DNA-binding GntR family transcriptional regulator